MTAKFVLGFAAYAMAASLMAQTGTPAKPAATTATVKPPAPAAPPRENGLYGTIATSLGNITVKMYEKESPITVKNFMDLSLGRKEWTDPKTRTRVKRPLYPGTIFHRVIPGFMIQGGDPTGTGMGGSDAIADEFDPSLSFDTPGKLAMANAGPGTGSCQFFITEVPTPHLTGKHTIFGQVVDGMDVVKKIINVPTGEQNRPLTPPKILRISFQRVGPGPAVPGSTPPVHRPAAGTATKTGAAKTGVKSAPATKK